MRKLLPLTALLGIVLTAHGQASQTRLPGAGAPPGSPSAEQYVTDLVREARARWL
jgi:hypothetical protein